MLRVKILIEQALKDLIMQRFALCLFFCISSSFFTESKPPITLKKSSQKIDFLTSMGWYSKSNIHWKQFHFFDKGGAPSKELKELELLKALYDRKIDILTSPQKKPVIPKIIHQIWIGPDTPPAVFKQSQESIKRLHPSWEYRLWTDTNISELKLYNRKMYELAQNYGAKADILRYELLHTYGGVYLDVDFVCVKPLDPLLSYDLWATIQPLDCKGVLNNAAIGSIPGHPILGYCIEFLESNWYRYEKTRNILEMVGPQHFHRSFFHFIQNKNMNIIALPASFFYPIRFCDRSIALKASGEKGRQKIATFLKPETYAIHYWSSSWSGPKV